MKISVFTLLHEVSHMYENYIYEKEGITLTAKASYIDPFFKLI